MGKKEKLRGKDLVQIGYKDTEIRSLAMLIAGQNYKYSTKAEKLEWLQKVIDDPQTYTTDKVWSPVAIKLLDAASKKEELIYSFEDKEYAAFGIEGIDDSAKEQMKKAMSLPITVKGALMPDAHHGYGLPIGGVLATQGAIIPYGVGVDIGCRMCLSVFEAKKEYLETHAAELKKILQNNTRFGKSIFDDNNREDEFFDRSDLRATKLLRGLKDKAYKQIGSSGGGNHFVEFGTVEITSPENQWNLPVGTYLALLSHSGSRGFGAMIANTYTKIAREKRQLPAEVAHLSWLHLDEAEGQEYWLGMNLAGDYASACHHHIHRRISSALGMNTVMRIENHHNFAWEDKLPDGQEIIVHRKGATPAHKGELGIIPGSMTAPAFIVQGRGHEGALYSAAHGAGRAFSRTKAKNSFTKKMLKDELKSKNVHLIGGGLDEAPFAYKNIHDVMRAQSDLVDILAAFYPKIVRMAGATS